MGIDELGLNEDDYKILKVIKYNCLNKPVSLETIASYINDDSENIRKINEPFLLNIGILERTPRGRKLTEFGEKALENYEKNIQPIT